MPATTLKYTVIKNKTQYKQYCKTLEDLLDSGAKTRELSNEIELLSLLIETWDEQHNSFNELDPVQLIHS
ncbi:MAG TPA: transcriptional regulator, partial [Chitinophagaceae bacterium]